ncbi:hypothetical protein DCO56_08990 [Sphingobacterium athyrii]|uniref:Uncharacterized protein n=1 Tax=Sphingobacterium athyrii TaxID=2152717 RepID=A0A363NWE2_9SPHI|nr:hypothetical protein DCO56_08990 [Sphingobacterium athyrii]
MGISGWKIETEELKLRKLKGVDDIYIEDGHIRGVVITVDRDDFQDTVWPICRELVHSEPSPPRETLRYPFQMVAISRLGLPTTGQDSRRAQLLPN